MQTVFIGLLLINYLHATPLFAVRFDSSGPIQILPDGSHRVQQKNGKIAKFRIDGGVSSTADVLWKIPSPNDKIVNSAGSIINSTVAELVHGECSEIDIQVTSVVKIVVGTKHACVLRQNGDVLCWGDNSHCQLGPNIPPGVFTTKAVIVLQNQLYSTLEVFGTVTCALNSTAGVCWGGIHPIKPSCSGRMYNVPKLDASHLLRLMYALVIVSDTGNFTITKTIVGGTMYNGRIAASETEILNDPSAVCSISDSLIECNNIHGFYVGNVFPLLSKPYSEPLSLDGPILFGQPGCGYKLVTKDMEIHPADAGKPREYQTRDGCLRILSCATSLPDNFLSVSNSVVKLVSGDSHVCFLDSAGDVFCRGDNSACQFITADYTSNAWKKINLPFKASNLVASGKVTCASDQDSVFCTGCISTGCVCNTRVTFRNTDGIVDITNTSICVKTGCIGTRGVATYSYTGCVTDEHWIMCGVFGYAADVLAFAESNNGIIVFTTRDGLLCVSDNGLRSVLCN